MDKCREGFEQSPKTKELLSDSIYFDEKENRYKVNADGCLISVVFLNGRWEVWQEQQAKVEEQAQEIANLKSLIQGHELRHQQNLSIKQKLTRRSEELQKRVDELERMFEIKWSDEQVAPQGHSGNRIIYGDCVLGKFSIWWRTWKAWDRPGLEINDEFITEARDVEEAKQLAKQYLEQALKGENHD